MNPIVPDESDNPFRKPSIKEAIDFWAHMHKNGLTSIVLFLLSFILLLLLFGHLIQRLFGNVIDIGLSSYIIPITVLVLFFFYFPSIPRTYEYQFKGKLKQDIPKEELNKLLMDLLNRSFYLLSIIIIAMCVLCTLVYVVAEYLGLSNVKIFILVLAAAVDIFLISLVAGSLGRYNRDFLRKTCTEEEYKRYTSPGNYKMIYYILAVFNILVVVILLTLK